MKVYQLCCMVFTSSRLSFDLIRSQVALVGAMKIMRLMFDWDNRILNSKLTPIVVACNGVIMLPHPFPNSILRKVSNIGVRHSADSDSQSSAGYCNFVTQIISQYFI